MAKILALVGSPRREGNSEILAAEFLKGVEEAGLNGELIRLNSLDIRSCQACDACAGSGYCVIRDDMRQLYADIAAAAGVLLITPIYFGSVTGQTKIFIDRFQCWYHAKYGFKRPFIKKEEQRPGYFISVGAWDKKEYSENALGIARTFFMVTNFQLHGQMHLTGYDHPGSVGEAAELLDKVKSAGKHFGDAALK